MMLYGKKQKNLQQQEQTKPNKITEPCSSIQQLTTCSLWFYLFYKIIFFSLKGNLLYIGSSTIIFC